MNLRKQMVQGGMRISWLRVEWQVGSVKFFCFSCLCQHPVKKTNNNRDCSYHTRYYYCSTISVRFTYVHSMLFVRCSTVTGRSVTSSLVVSYCKSEINDNIIVKNLSVKCSLVFDLFNKNGIFSFS